VVDFWRAQATPTNDQSFLIARPDETEGEEGAQAEDFAGRGKTRSTTDAVRVVIRDGKASTSTLQRRLPPRLRPRRAHPRHDAA